MKVIDAHPGVFMQYVYMAQEAHSHGVRTYMLPVADNCHPSCWQLPFILLTIAIHLYGSCHSLLWQLSFTFMAIVNHSTNSILYIVMMWSLHRYKGCLHIVIKGLSLRYMQINLRTCCILIYKAVSLPLKSEIYVRV